MTAPLPALLFDLDGTLIDSIELILGSARHAFIGFQGATPTDDEWRATIGRPLQRVLMDYTWRKDTADRQGVSSERADNGRPAMQAGHDGRLG